MVNTIREDVRDVLQKVLIMKPEEMEKVKNDEQLEIIGLNSILLLQFIVQLEQKLDVEIDEELINKGNFQTIDSIANFIATMKS